MQVTTTVLNIVRIKLFTPCSLFITFNKPVNFSWGLYEYLLLYEISKSQYEPLSFFIIIKLFLCLPAVSWRDRCAQLYTIWQEGTCISEIMHHEDVFGILFTYFFYAIFNNVISELQFSRRSLLRLSVKIWNP